jgi:protein TonB
MSRPAHPWTRARRNAGRRFLIGTSVALSLTLVAFEWRSEGHRLTLPPELEDVEPPIEYPPVVIIKQETAAAKPEVQRRRPNAGIIVAVDPTPVVDPGPVPPEPGTGPAVDPLPMPGSSLRPEEVVEPGPRPWDGVEQRPYFKECLTRSANDLDGCTEARIDAHLQRHFRVPQSVRRDEFTVITLEIDATGNIGRLVCAPKPSAAVQAEIERVIRALPVFMPGSQNGLAVPVIYQLPFRVTRL